MNENEINKMRQLEKLILRPKKKIIMKPKSYHLMLIGLKNEFHDQDTLNCNIQWAQESIKTSTPFTAKKISYEDLLTLFEKHSI